jgi:hypothetical protein
MRERTGKQALHAVGVGADERRDFATGEVRGGVGGKGDVVAELVKLHVLADLRQKLAERARSEAAAAHPLDELHNVGKFAPGA